MKSSADVKQTAELRQACTTYVGLCICAAGLQVGYQSITRRVNLTLSNQSHSDSNSTLIESVAHSQSVGLSHPDDLSAVVFLLTTLHTLLLPPCSVPQVLSAVDRNNVFGEKAVAEFSL